VHAVRGIDFEVEQGEIFGLLGPNGAGKTTTVEILEGLRTRTSGDVTVLGKDPAVDVKALKDRIGVCLQSTNLPEKITVREALALFSSFYSRHTDIDKLIDRLQLGEKRNAFYQTLSGGQKQRVALALALVNDPQLVFLDEPTTGLDPQSRLQLWDVIEEFKKGGRSVLITTHYMDEAERLCDRVGVVDHGKLIALGSPRDLIASLGGQEVIELTLEGDAPLDEAAAAKLPGVHGVRHAGSGFVLAVDPLHVALPALVDHLRVAGRTLERLSTRHATLEDVFVSLTGRHLRD
jgi:ABC-2 type transport system ATP-binding protein